MGFQSTLPVGGATARRHDSDGMHSISIHAPRGGSDRYLQFGAMPRRRFQSTLPVGGATSATSFRFHNNYDFNPRSPWGERPSTVVKTPTITIFQSTLPVGGATADILFSPIVFKISIHAPRGGSDRLRACLRPLLTISIHAPRGGSDFKKKAAASYFKLFQSTLPVGGATNHLGIFLRPRVISIHAPRGGSDSTVQSMVMFPKDFNPRSPWGERPRRTAGTDAAP